MSIGLFADMKFYLPGEEIPPPQTAVGLLVDLHVETKAKELQQAAVTNWLDANEASRALLDDLTYYDFTV